MKESIYVLLTLGFPVVICKSQTTDEYRPPEGPALSSVRLQWGVKQTHLHAFVPQADQLGQEIHLRLL